MCVLRGVEFRLMDSTYLVCSTNSNWTFDLHSIGETIQIPYLELLLDTDSLNSTLRKNIKLIFHFMESIEIYMDFLRLNCDLLLDTKFKILSNLIFKSSIGSHLNDLAPFCNWFQFFCVTKILNSVYHDAIKI